MTSQIPSALQPPGYEQSISQIREALERRVTNATNRISATADFHRGTPNPDALPEVALGIWLDWVHIGPDAQDETNRATFLQSEWVCYIVGLDEGSDQFGTEIGLVERVWADITTTLTESQVDIGLDGACDIVDVPNADRDTVFSGNRRHRVIRMNFSVRHQMEITRID